MVGIDGRESDQSGENVIYAQRFCEYTARHNTASGDNHHCFNFMSDLLNEHVKQLFDISPTQKFLTC